MYRIPFDFIEQWSMSFADSIAVNSGFTKGVVGKVWPDLVAEKDLQIVYPCVDIKEKKTGFVDEPVSAWHEKNILLSINRFERKKDIGLAIKAYAGLGKEGRKGTMLVLAGKSIFWGKNKTDAKLLQVAMTIVSMRMSSITRNSSNWPIP